MKKEIVIALSAVLVLAGCGGWFAPKFDASSIVPADAKNVVVYDVDFDDDGSAEKVVTYALGLNTMLLVFHQAGQTWLQVYDDAFGIGDQAATTYLHDVQTVDFGDDGMEEVFVQWSYDRPLGIGSYYVISLQDGLYTTAESTYIDETELLDRSKGESELLLSSYDITSEGVVEHYSVYCEVDMGGKPQATRYEKSCRVADVLVEYADGAFFR